ncbi:MAG TPA: hypothetical protein V6D35_06465 [Candidatus Sericytochromatia bacterium]
MTFTGDCPDGRSQDLTCAEADGKIVIDKILVNKLTELLIISIYSVHTSRRSEIFLTSLDMHLSEDLVSNKKEIVRCDFAEKSLLLLQSYQKDVPKMLGNAERSLGDAIDLINLVVSASKSEGDNE